ncbi:MAG: hypothetical protein QM758_16920, partial [Armatimonas sp.]
MPNQPLEDSVDNLRRCLRFLPEAEREAEVAEFRSHLQERLTAYENAGEPTEQALASTLEKWGEPRNLVRELRYRWIRHKIDSPILIALFLLIVGHFVIYGLNLLVFWYLPAFSQSHNQRIQIAFGLFLIFTHGLATAGIALPIAKLRLKNQIKGVALYAALYFVKLAYWYYRIPNRGPMDFFGKIKAEQFL